MNQYTNENPYTEEFYIENLRKMGGEKRLKIGFDLRDLAVNLCKEGIRQQNPGLDEKGIEKELFRRLGYEPICHCEESRLWRTTKQSRV